jgi:hypothetical protein
MTPQELAEAWAEELAEQVEDARRMGRQCWIDHKGLASFFDRNNRSWIEARRLMQWAEREEFRIGGLAEWANRCNASVNYLQAIWLEGYYSAFLNELLGEEVAK